MAIGEIGAVRQPNEGRQTMPLWLKYGVIALISLGVFFRFYQLDRKVYWIDETNSSLRSLGYTKTELIDTLFTGEPVTAAELRQFQQLDPNRGWGDTWKALTGTAEHTPLYFLLARAWVGLVGHSVATMRALTALFSLLVFPALYWLCRELFDPVVKPEVAHWIGWVSLGLFAIMPMHVLYAQEARPYSLLSVLILVSSALLLRAARSANPWTWLLYGLSVVAGLYSQLLFSLVVLAHGFYMLLTRQLSRAYLLAAGLASLTLLPWLLLLVKQWEKVSHSTRSLRDSSSWGYIFDRWCLNLNLAFLSQELGAANLLLVAALLIALYLFCRRLPKRTWLFVLLLIGVPFVVLAVPDLLWGGRRSLRIRYLLPSLFGFQLVLAYGFATWQVWSKPLQRYFWQGLMLVLVIGGLVAAGTNAHAIVPWPKSLPRSGYYLPVAEIVNQGKNPLVISDGPVTDVLAFSAWLRPDVTLQLPLERKFRLARKYEPIYLLNASEQLQEILSRRGYGLSVAYVDRSDSKKLNNRLWLAQRKPQ